MVERTVIEGRPLCLGNVTLVPLSLVYIDYGRLSENSLAQPPNGEREQVPKKKAYYYSRGGIRPVAVVALIENEVQVLSLPAQEALDADEEIRLQIEDIIVKYKGNYQRGQRDKGIRR